MTDLVIHLARHAQAAGDNADAELSDVGIQQATALGRRVASNPPAKILTSRYRRANQTAAIIGLAAGLIPERSEFADDLTPIPTEADVNDYPARLLPWFEEVPIGERDPGGEKIERAFAALLEPALAAGPSGILVVTHAFVIGRVVQQTLSLGAPAWLNLQSDNTGLTSIGRRPDGTLQLLRFNDTGHLY